MNETTDEHGSVFICTTNVQIHVRRSKIFLPRRREEREEKRFQKLCVLRVFAVDFLGCGWAALCSSVVAFCAIYADENPCSLRRIFGVRPRPPYSKPPYSDEIQDLLLCEAGEPRTRSERCCFIEDLLSIGRGRNKQTKRMLKGVFDVCPEQSALRQLRAANPGDFRGSPARAVA